VVRRPTEPGDVARAIAGLLADPDRRAAMGVAARRRAEASFDYDLLAPRLARSLGDGGG
jgi:glycosyltransferase involved in cell wall biosynthesis